MISGTVIDTLCQYCGRPIIGQFVTGHQGMYHPECTQGPAVQPNRYFMMPEHNLAEKISSLEKRVSELERFLVHGGPST